MKQSLDSGIATPPSQFGEVSEFDAREAAVFVLCPWHIWLTLDWRERAAAVAHYRLHLLVEAHVSEASQDAAKASQRSAG